ncbi:hypothetical protein LTR10_016762 [Elasticomyces elasticus]|uniref:NAD(P)-binding protein n=1 Tax=Exophiala sideris TaxID=1016849 RepID=A0ABR0JNN5_9EURO|nr:hypothetical protein LTR10_016762 [Elasticomyces elasticus]KAK5037766.1 hypothetical protein LTS07_001233 [Exophiala sideris]KAK5043748.1 hypothetical protein LTR13_000102 [Exophiala sideris]KAK5067247.1 hypothetical protein LTR69_001234 [Exophiala sideris]KAK5182580.1 hypothetical protein LTR44_004971 [Eurotiomycetes sp. CCFEE 6388]
MASTVVLISGANRGIGKELLKRYIARSNYTVIAANRDPEHVSSKELANLPRGSNSRLIVVKVDAVNDEDALNAAKELERQGIEHIDLVIANAAVAYAFGKVSHIAIDVIKGHFEPNFYGVIRLYHAMLPLLLKSSHPKWATVGSIAGSIEAAVHWLTKRMDEEEEKLTAFVVTPGWVTTDMGNMGARELFGLEQAPDNLDESCDGMVKLFDEATKETHGGKFWRYTGKEEAW